LKVSVRQVGIHTKNQNVRGKFQQKETTMGERVAVSACEANTRIGDLVTLKSGGPRMVVMRLIGPTAGCYWMDKNDQAQSYSFLLLCLLVWKQSEEKLQ